MRGALLTTAGPATTTGASVSSVTSASVASTGPSSVTASSSSGSGGVPCTPSDPGPCCYLSTCDAASTCCVDLSSPHDATCATSCGSGMISMQCDDSKDC